MAIARILLVEDEKLTLNFLTSNLTQVGYDVHTAQNGNDGLKLFETQAFDLVISDVNMPGMDGLEMVRKEAPDLITLDLEMPGEWGPRFYRKMRQDKAYRDIPVIVISGIDGDHAIKDAVAFVSKPFDPEKIIGIVKNTIG